MLVFGLLFYLPIRLGDSGREISVSVFDVALVAICYWQVRRGRFVWSPLVWWSTAVIAVLAAMAAAYLAIRPDIQVAGLLRESVKYIGFVSGVTICALLFLNNRLSAPSAKTMAVLCLSLLLVWLTRIAIMSPEKNALIVNGYSNVAIGLLIVFLYFYKNEKSPHVWIGALAYSLAVICIAIWIRATATSLAAIGAFVLISWYASRNCSDRSVILRVLPYLCLILIGGGVAFVFFYDQPNVFDSRHLNEGAAIRISLWYKAIGMIKEGLPFGIGPGQFGKFGFTEVELIQSTPIDIFRFFFIDSNQLSNIGKVPLRFVHNSFVAMGLEWGVIGLLLGGVLIFLVIRSLRVLGIPGTPCYVFLKWSR